MSASTTKIKFTYLVAWTMTTEEMICIVMTFIQTTGSYYPKLVFHPHLDLVQEELHSKINFCFLEATRSKTVNTMMISFRMIYKHTHGALSKTRELSLVSGLITQWFCMGIVCLFLEGKMEQRDSENFINVPF
jgi:hypothetical protein